MEYKFIIPSGVSAVQVVVGFNEILPEKSFVLCPSYNHTTTDELISHKNTIYKNFTWSNTLNSFFLYSKKQTLSNNFQVFPSVGVPNIDLNNVLIINIHPWDAPKDTISDSLKSVIVCGETRKGPIVIYPEN